MSSTLGDDKDSVLCKTVMDDLEYSHNVDNACEIHEMFQKLGYKKWEWRKAVLVCCVRYDSKKASALDTEMRCSDHL